MKITEMNNCIEEMRKCYKFEDDKTEIRLGSVPSAGCDRHVFVSTMNENGRVSKSNGRNIYNICKYIHD